MDLDPSSKAMRFNTVFYHAYLFRYVDMCDTFFFIMRKKYRNVNALQVGTCGWYFTIYKIYITLYRGPGIYGVKGSVPVLF